VKATPTWPVAVVALAITGFAPKAICGAKPKTPVAKISTEKVKIRMRVGPLRIRSIHGGLKTAKKHSNNWRMEAGSDLDMVEAYEPKAI
jgi:hypothetical protein